MKEDRVLGIGEERRIEFPYHTPIRKEEKKHTKTEVWLAKKGIKEDNKSLKGGKSWMNTLMIAGEVWKERNKRRNIIMIYFGV